MVTHHYKGQSMSIFPSWRRYSISIAEDKAFPCFIPKLPTHLLLIAWIVVPFISEMERAREVTPIFSHESNSLYVFHNKKILPISATRTTSWWEGKWYHMPLASAIQMLRVKHMCHHWAYVDLSIIGYAWFSMWTNYAKKKWRGGIHDKVFFCEIRALMPEEKSLIKGLFGRNRKEWEKGRQGMKRPPLIIVWKLGRTLCSPLLFLSNKTSNQE